MVKQTKDAGVKLPKEFVDIIDEHVEKKKHCRELIL